MVGAMSSTSNHEPEWHVRWQRPKNGTLLLSFVDADANRVTFREFLTRLESSERFRAAFVAALAGCELKAFVWEMPAIGARSLVYEFECALTEAAVPPKVKVNPNKFGDHFREGEPVAVFDSPEADGSIIAPSPRGAEGWYADLGTFLRRVDPAQVHALWQAVAKTAKAMVAKERIRIRSSAPGAPWLHVRVGPSAKPAAFSGYAAG